jgi:hypothetical protein
MASDILAGKRLPIEVARFNDITENDAVRATVVDLFKDKGYVVTYDSGHYFTTWKIKKF